MREKLNFDCKGTFSCVYIFNLIGILTNRRNTLLQRSLSISLESMNSHKVGCNFCVDFKLLAFSLSGFGMQ